MYSYYKYIQQFGRDRFILVNSFGVKKGWTSLPYVSNRVQIVINIYFSEMCEFN